MPSAVSPLAADDSPRRRIADLLARGVVSLPDRIPTLMLWATLVATVFAVIGAFRPLLVLPVLLVVIVVTWRLVPTPPSPSRSGVLGSIAAAAMILGWIVVNVPLASRYVIVDRDPGFLTLEAMWLSGHASPNPSAGDLARVASEGQVVASSGAFTFSRTTGDFHVQGTKGLPAVLGMGGWAVGDIAALAGNLVLAGVALFAVYAFARRLMGPWWSLLPVAGLAVGVPMTVFSRAAYTEPLTMGLVFLALTFGHSAFSGRRRSHFAMSGLAVGAGAMIRIDGSLQVIGLLVAIALAAAFTTAPRARRVLRSGFVLALVCAVVPIGLSYLDLQLNSQQYLRAQGPNYTMLLLALAASTVGAVAVLALVRPGLRAFYRRHARVIGLVTGALVLVLAVFLISRPLWYVGHHLEGVYSVYLESLQTAQGLTVDGSLSFDQYTVNWLAWYLGWPTVILGFLGLAAIGARTLRRRDPRLLMFLGVVAAPSALYLWSINITPDQVWAIRRLLPVTIPGVLIAAAWCLSVLWRTRRPRGVRWIALPLAASLVVLPVFAWNGLFTVREHDGRYGELIAACDALTSDRVIYVNRGGPDSYLESLTLACDVEVVEVSSMDSPDRVEQIVDAWGGGQVDVIAFDPESVPWAEPAIPLRLTETTQWARSVQRLPSTYRTTTSVLYHGVTLPDGRVQPVG